MLSCNVPPRTPYVMLSCNVPPRTPYVSMRKSMFGDMVLRRKPREASIPPAIDTDLVPNLLTRALANGAEGFKQRVIL